MTRALRASRRALHSEVVLRRRPAANQPVCLSCFEPRPQPLPPRTPAPHEVLCRTVYLSVDPFLRCRFNASTGVGYTQPYALGEPIASAGIGEVLQVGDAVRGLAPGDLVVEPFDSFPWQSVAVLEAAKVQRVPPLLALLLPPSALLGACGQTGLTAWCGLETVGGGRPNGSDVVAVSGAAGAVGSLVGQLCKRRGAAVVGVCGSEAKVDFLQELGFDRALNRHSADLRADLRAALLSVPQADRALGTSRSPQPADITLYWDNVGGAVSDLVIQCMAPRSELLLCGQISTYDAEGDYPPPLPAESAAVVERRRIRRERYTVVKYKHRFAPALAELCALVAAEARRRGRRDAAPVGGRRPHARRHPPSGAARRGDGVRRARRGAGRLHRHDGRRQHGQGCRAVLGAAAARRACGCAARLAPAGAEGTARAVVCDARGVGRRVMPFFILSARLRIRILGALGVQVIKTAHATISRHQRGPGG